MKHSVIQLGLTQSDFELHAILGINCLAQEFGERFREWALAERDLINYYVDEVGLHAIRDQNTIIAILRGAIGYEHLIDDKEKPGNGLYRVFTSGTTLKLNVRKEPRRSQLNIQFNEAERRALTANYEAFLEKVREHLPDNERRKVTHFNSKSQGRGFRVEIRTPKERSLIAIRC